MAAHLRRLVLDLVGVLMSEAPFKVGDVVRVRDPDGFVSAVADKIRDRDATVEDVYVPMGSTSWHAIVRFHKRNGRGKEFTENFRAMWLRLRDE